MDDVAVFPQCYAAVVDKIPTMAKKTLIVDIGSWTIDIMPVINKSPDESKCVTIPKGLITCMRSINEQCVRQLNGEVDESEIQNIMRYGRSDIDDEYFAIIKAEMRLLRKAFLHAADIFCGVPKCIILRADKEQLTADILDLYEFLLSDRMRRFRVVKQLAGGNHIAGAFGLLRDYAPIVRVLIAKRHVWQGLSLVRKE